MCTVNQCFSGPIGPNGARSFTIGATGPDGIPGAMGMTGSAGTAGPAGETGATGPSAGSNTVTRFFSVNYSRYAPDSTLNPTIPITEGILTTGYNMFSSGNIEFQSSVSDGINPDFTFDSNTGIVEYVGSTEIITSCNYNSSFFIKDFYEPTPGGFTSTTEDVQGGSYNPLPGEGIPTRGKSQNLQLIQADRIVGTGSSVFIRTLNTNNTFDYTWKVLLDNGEFGSPELYSASISAIEINQA